MPVSAASVPVDSRPRLVGTGRASALLVAALAILALPAGPAEAQGFGGSAAGQPRQLFPQPSGRQPDAGTTFPESRPAYPDTPDRSLSDPSFPERSAPDGDARQLSPSAPAASPFPLPRDDALPAAREGTPLFPGGSEPGTAAAPQPQIWVESEPRLLPGRQLPSEMEREGTLRLRGGIEVDRLGGVPETAGPLEPGEGGLGLDLWAGTDRDTVVRLLGAMPREIESPALRDLAVRLLLTSASPPSGRGTGAAPGAILRARAELLRDLGATDGLRRLLARVPEGAAGDPALARLQVEAALLERDRAEACRLVRGGPSPGDFAAFWQEALIYCQISEGESAAAGVGLSLLREAGDGDPEIQALAEAALGLREPPEPQRAEALVLAYLAALDRPPSRAMVERAAPGLLPALARQPRLEPELRLQLAERAAEVGALPPRALAEAYERERYSADELDAPLQRAVEIGGPRGRALLFKGAWRTRVPDERAALLAAFLEAAADEGLELGALRVAERLFLDLNPGPELIAVAPVAARSLLVAGRLESAGAWIAVLRAAAPANSQARRDYAELWPLARVAGLERNGPLDVQGWAAQRAAFHDPVRVEREQTLLRALLAALDGGETQGMPPLFSQAGGAAPPSPGALYGLRGAAADGRRGETVLNSLLLLGNGPPGQAHPQALVEAAGALAAVGLVPEARAIALEALLLQGF